MKRTKYNEQFVAMSAVARRMNLAKLLSTQTFNGNRNTYAEFGYPLVLGFNDFLARYQRQDMAKAIIDRPVLKTWTGGVKVVDINDNSQTSDFEEAWSTMYDTFKLSQIFTRTDKLTGIGKYGVLMLGFDDVTTIMDYKNPVSGTRKLLYLKPFSEESAKIATVVTDPKDERFGLPLTYTIQVGEQTSTSAQIRTLEVHYSRLIHVIDDILESEVEGYPRLQSVFNRLIDLEKLVGGSAEMYWKSARPGFAGNLGKDTQASATFKEDFDEQLQEYEHGLTRMLLMEGVDIKELKQQLGDPKSNVDVQIEMISAVTQIPKRILTGSERGELASSQDKEEANAYITTRREQFAEPNLLRPFIDKMIEMRVLPTPDGEKYKIIWPDVFTMSEKERAEVGETRAKAIKEYSTNPAAEAYMPPQAFLSYVLGLTDAQVEDILNELRETMGEETPLSPEEEEILETTNEINEEE